MYEYLGRRGDKCVRNPQASVCLYRHVMTFELVCALSFMRDVQAIGVSVATESVRSLS